MNNENPLSLEDVFCSQNAEDTEHDCKENSIWGPHEAKWAYLIIPIFGLIFSKTPYCDTNAPQAPRITRSFRPRPGRSFRFRNEGEGYNQQVWQKVGWLPGVRGKAVTFLTTTGRLRVHIQDVTLGSAPAVTVGTSCSLKQQADVTASFGHVQSAERGSLFYCTQQKQQHRPINSWVFYEIGEQLAELSALPLKNYRKEGTGMVLTSIITRSDSVLNH
jgi:hypothetical protein